MYAELRFATEAPRNWTFGEPVALCNPFTEDSPYIIVFWVPEAFDIVTNSLFRLAVPFWDVDRQ